MKNRKGFTLVELIVVVAILGVLMAVLVPQYIQYVEKTRVAADEAYIGEMSHAMELIAAGNETVGGKTCIVQILPTGEWFVASGPDNAADGELERELQDIIGEGTAFKSKKYSASEAGIVKPKVTLELHADGRVTVWDFSITGNRRHTP